MALARKAELLLHDGRHGEALEAFQQAYQLNPQDDSIRTSLVRSLLTALRDNFAANQKHALELENLIDQPAEQLEFCRWMAVGLKKQGEIEQAAAYFIRLASMSIQTGFGADIDGPEMVRIDDQLHVHRDRWLSVQVQQLCADARSHARTDRPHDSGGIDEWHRTNRSQVETVRGSFSRPHRIRGTNTGATGRRVLERGNL